MTSNQPKSRTVLHRQPGRTRSHCGEHGLATTCSPTSSSALKIDGGQVSGKNGLRCVLWAATAISILPPGLPSSRTGGGRRRQRSAISLSRSSGGFIAMFHDNSTRNDLHR